MPPHARLLRVAVLAAAVLAVTAGVVAAAAHLLVPLPVAAEPRAYWLMGCVAAVSYGLTALLLARRGTAPAVAATAAGTALALGLSTSAGEVAAPLLAAGRRGTALELLVWVGSWLWAPGYVLVVAVLPLLLPDGVVRSRRRRAALLLSLGAVAAVTVWWALLPYASQDLPVAPADLRNPVGVAAAGHPAVAATVAAWCLLAAAVAVAALLQRWLRASGEERRRLGWVVLGALATGALLASAQVLDGAAAELLVAVAMVPLPAGCAVAAVRHGLWGVEVALSRSMAYAVLAAGVVLAYVAVVAALGGLLGTTTGAPLVATVVVALAVLPLHARLQRVVNRLVHGDVTDPWPALAVLGDRLEATADPADVAGRVLPQLVARALEVLRVDAVVVELADGGRVCAGEATGEETRVPLTYAGSTVGALVVRAARPLPSGDVRVLERLARQVAVAVHAVLLAREAQRSRELVVAAREEERRRLRRDLHDGLGPSLAACALQAEAARDLAGTDATAAVAVLDRLVPRLTATVDEVRGIVHDLRPPTLDELGLAGAVHELVARLGHPGIEVHTSGDLGPARLPAAVDVAAYRIVGEALTNVVRHAAATRTAVRLERGPDRLVVTVTDDGTGIPPQRRGGVGLLSMAERTAELGGRLEVGPAPAGGTLVRAELPTRPAAGTTGAEGPRPEGPVADALVTA